MVKALRTTRLGVIRVGRFRIEVASALARVQARGHPAPACTLSASTTLAPNSKLCEMLVSVDLYEDADTWELASTEVSRAPAVLTDEDRRRAAGARVVTWQRLWLGCAQQLARQR